MTLAIDSPQVETQVGSQNQADPLINGDVLLKTRSHTPWGGGVTALLYLPLQRDHVWQAITDYPRWPHYLPNLFESVVLEQGPNTARLHQMAGEEFLMLKIKVAIDLKVTETPQRRIQFEFERGNFKDFAADLRLQDYQTGTLLSYSVQATPTIPVPSALIQQGIKMDLPHNLRHLRQALCGH